MPSVWNTYKIRLQDRRSAVWNTVVVVAASPTAAMAVAESHLRTLLGESSWIAEEVKLLSANVLVDTEKRG